MSSPLCTILGNQVRIELIYCLSKGELTVSQLIAHCGMSQSSVSQHLQKLRLADMVTVRKEGKEKHYSVTDPRIISIVKLVHTYTKSRS